MEFLVALLFGFGAGVVHQKSEQKQAQVKEVKQDKKEKKK